MKPIRKSFLKYLIELLIVAFGVFLGSWVNEWVAQKKVDKQVRQSMRFIREELEINRRQAERVIAYHQQVKDSFEVIRADIPREAMMDMYVGSQAFRFTSIPGWYGVSLPSYETIAFEGAKLSGITREFDLETLQLISQAYKLIEFNGEFGRSVLDKMLAMDSETKVIDAMGMIDLLTSDVLNDERSIKAMLDEILAVLDAKE